MLSCLAQRNWRSLWFGSLISLAILPALLLAADRGGKAGKAPQDAAADAQAVDMFDAIQKGDIAVRLIPKDSKEGRVLIENKTKQPLNVKLPEAFAATPVLAQIGGMGGGGMGRQGMGGQGQGMGGGMMGGGGGMGFQSIAPEKVGMKVAPGAAKPGPAAMYVAPEKVGQIKVTTVCLEHGKPEPRSSMQYELKPVESFTQKPGVYELCRMVGAGQINQRVAQAAAWHLNNDMSWEKLAGKRMKFANGNNQPYFSPQEIQAGMQVAAVAVKMAEERQKQTGSKN